MQRDTKKTQGRDPTLTQTLQDLRKSKFPTIKAFAEACGFSTSKASTVLQGRHVNAMSTDEARYIANVLDVSFQEFANAMDASYAEWHEQNMPKPQRIPEAIRSKSPIDLIPLTNLRKV